MTDLIVQHCKANNDVNGNPRRCWAIYAHDGRVGRLAGRIRVVDEGYEHGSAESALKSCGLPTDAYVEVPPVHVTPGEYRDLVTAGERLDPANPWRVVWIDDGTVYGFARSESVARRMARDYNRPWRDEGPRVRAERNDPARLIAEPTLTAGYRTDRGEQ